MFCEFLDVGDTIFFFWEPILDHLVDWMWLGNKVHFSNVISLFEEEVSIVKYVCNETMPFDIDFDDTFHIHEFYVINEEEACVDKDNSVLWDEHNSSIVVYRIQCELEKDIIDTDK